MMFESNEKNFQMYIGGRTPEGGIYRFALKNGSLSLIEKISVPLPMYFAVADGRFYSLLRAPFSDRSTSGVCSWKIEKDGSLTQPTPILDTLGECGCHLYVENGSIYVTNYISGNVSVLPQNTVDQHAKYPQLNKVPHTHCVIPTPDEKYLLVTDLGLDEITLYSKELEPIAKYNVPSGHGPRHMCFSENGRYLFCVNELASTVSVFVYETGAMTLLGTYGGVPESYHGTTSAAAIRVCGNQVFISHRGMDCIEIFEMTDDNALRHLDYIPCEGQSPRDFALFDRWLICTNELTDTVTCFYMDDSGKYYLRQTLAVPHPLCVLMLPDE